MIWIKTKRDDPIAYHSRMARRKSETSAQLFAEPEGLKPLAERMRPRTLDEIVGQTRLLGPGTALRRSIEAGHVH